MTQKTNQFNLTTKRYSESEINNFIENGHYIYSLGVKDKFGDVVRALIVVRKNSQDQKQSKSNNKKSSKLGEDSWL